MSLAKLPDFDFCVWEIISPVFTVEVGVSNAGGLKTESLLFSFEHLDDLVSAVGSTLTSSRPWHQPAGQHC